MDRYSTLDRSISIEKRRGGWIDIRHSKGRYRSHARRGVTEIHARDKDEMTFCCWLVRWLVGWLVGWMVSNIAYRILFRFHLLRFVPPPNDLLHFLYIDTYLYVCTYLSIYCCYHLDVYIYVYICMYVCISRVLRTLTIYITLHAWIPEHALDAVRVGLESEGLIKRHHASVGKERDVTNLSSQQTPDHVLHHGLAQALSLHRGVHQHVPNRRVKGVVTRRPRQTDQTRGHHLQK